MYGQPLQRSAPPGTAAPSVQRRRFQVSESSAGTAAPAARDATDEAALKVPMLEAEVLSLREKLAEVQAKREHLRREIDDLRRERDHWRNLAKSAAAEKEATRTWFCGRASPSK